MNCYKVRVGPLVQELSLSETEMSGQHLTSMELLNRLAPLPPFSIAGVTVSLWSGPESAAGRKEVKLSTDCCDGMDLECAFDAKALMRHVIENSADVVQATQCLWVLGIAKWSPRDRLRATNLSMTESVLRLLGRYPDDAAFAESALAALLAITTGSSENVARLGSAGCTTVFTTVTKFAAPSRILYIGCCTLAQASSNRENMRNADVAAWTDFCLRTIDSSRGDVALQGAAFTVLGNTLSLCSQSLSDQGQVEVATISLRALKEQRAASAIIQGACQALGSLAGVPAVRSLISENGGLMLLVTVLRELESISNGDDVAAAVLKAIADILADLTEKEGGAQVAVAEGIVDVVLQRLTLSMQSAVVAEHGFHALKILFLESQNQLSGGSDALDLIISGLDVHRTNLIVVLYACEALELLMETAEVQELVFFTELFNVLVTAMQTMVDPSSAAASPVNSRSSSSSSIRLGMSNLPPPPVMRLDSPLSEPANRSAIPPLPPDLKLLAPITGNLHVSAVLVAACTALSAAMGSNFFERARSAGAAEVVCSILRKYSNFTNVVEHASWTLSRLAFTTLGQIQLGNLGAVKLLVDALIIHKDDAVVVECVIYGISNLTFDPNNSIALLSHGAFRMITGLISKYPTSEVIVERACVCLSNLLTVQEDLSIVRVEGTIPVIIQVLRDFIESPDVVEQALWAMGNMIGDDVQNKDAAIAGGIKSNIKTIGNKYADNEDIMIQLRRVKNPVNKVWWLPDFDWLLS